MILEIIITAIFTATVFNIIFHKINMPTIIGYILTGTIITYSFGLHESVSNYNIKMIAEFGIVFLMFSIGLEFSLKHLIKMKKDVFLFGGMQFVFTSVIIYLISFFIGGFDLVTSLIISLGFSLSSTAIVLKILNEDGEINKNYGKKSLGILIFQDLIVIPILLLITIISENDGNIGILLIETLSSAIVLLFVLWIFNKFLLNTFLYKVVKTKSNEIFIGSVLFIIIGASSLAHLMGFSYSLGAFIAGILIAETQYKHKVEADLIPFRDLLLGFFFISVGMQLNLEIIRDNILLIMISLVVLIIIKLLVIYLVLLKYTGNRTAFKTAATLFQFGEFGIVIFDLSTSKSLIDGSLSQTLIVIIILSMIITPIILKNIDSITDFITNKKLPKNNPKNIDKIKYKTILIGYGRLGKEMSKILDKNDIKHLIIENFIKPYKEGRRDGKNIIFGNAYQEAFLKSVKIQYAKNIIISVGKNEKLFLVASIIRKMNIEGTITVKVHNFEEKNMLEKLDIKNIIVETEKTSLAMLEGIIKKT